MQNIVPMSRHILELRHGQHLTLTPALQQSIRLLQLSTLDLEAEVSQAIAENPMLEQEGEAPSAPVAIPTDWPGSDAPGDPVASAEQLPDAPAADSDKGDSDREFERDRTEYSGEGRSSRDDESDTRPETVRQTTLREHLLAQLATTRFSARDAALVEMLIDELDDDGMLASPIEEIAGWLDPALGIEAEDFRAALNLLHSFDPPGVGARDLAQCLDLQLAYADPVHFPEARDAELIGMARMLCQRHLPLLATGNMARLREALHCDAEMLRRAHALVLRLNPRPGSAWNVPAADFAIPDVIVRKTRAGWVAMLNDAVVPRLRINQLYAEALGSPRAGTNSALHGQLQEARWLIRNVAQRFETILRVAQAIVVHQQAFFSRGWEAIRPLTLKDIAAELGMHESTISRATTQKFMLTSFGTLELKRFFSAGLSAGSGGGEGASATSVQTRIQALIEAEDRSRPLSDSQLVTVLETEGVKIARRTVAKYRELLRIPTAPLRKSQAGAG